MQTIKKNTAHNKVKCISRNKNFDTDIQRLTSHAPTLRNQWSFPLKGGLRKGTQNALLKGCLAGETPLTEQTNPESRRGFPPTFSAHRTVHSSSCSSIQYNPFLNSSGFHWAWCSINTSRGLWGWPSVNSLRTICTQSYNWTFNRKMLTVSNLELETLTKMRCKTGLRSRGSELLDFPYWIRRHVQQTDGPHKMNQ